MLTMILATVFFSINGNSASGSKKPPDEPIQETVEPTPSTVLPYDKEVTAVVTSINQGADTFSLLDTVTEEVLFLTYSGASDIRDKYGQLLAGSQIKVGDIANILYDADTKRIASLTLSPNTWEYHGVTNLEIDPSIHKMTIGDAIYRYSDSLLVLNQGSSISLDLIGEGDQLTVTGIENEIFVLQVTRGHGYLALEDSEDFIGGNIQVGNEFIMKITNPMKIKVKEGEHLIIVTNKEYKGQKSVKIDRFQTLSLNLAEFGKIPVETGLVNFSIYPEGADLFVDGAATSYEKPVELAYGDHEIEVSLGGYITFQGKLNVKQTDDIYKVTLKEGSGNLAVSPSTSVTPTLSSTPSKPIQPTITVPTVPNVPTVTAPALPSGETQDNTSDNTKDDFPFPTIPDATTALTPVPTATPTREPSPAPTQAPDNPSSTKNTITIKCTDGAEVLLNGKSMGKIQNGSLTFAKQTGKITFSLLLDGHITKHYVVTVEDNNADAIFSFPAMVSS